MNTGKSIREKIQKPTNKAKPTLPCLLLLILVAMLAPSISCYGQATATSPEPAIASYTDVTPKEAHDMIGQQEVIILDVRTQEEYDSGYISDAVLIPLAELESRMNELNPADSIIVYCRSGLRSEEAASTLVANDFVHVYNMEGGITQWQTQGLPVTKKHT